jgi:Na+-transporting methylmalonyl-CoA/oxaloacetate decarboxylase gamma subunit
MEQTLAERLVEAAILVGVGMAVVFSALAILMVSIMIINRLAPDRAKKTEGSVLLEAIQSEDSEKGRIAAMAVALAKAMENDRDVIGEQRVMGVVGWAGEPSRWAAAGREQVMRSRGKAGRQWGRRSD